MRNPLLFSLFFPLFAFIARPLKGAPAPLIDLAGKKVLSGTEYYMLPIFQGPGSGRGGGLNLFYDKNKTCPLEIIQEKLHILKGLPLTFSSHDEEEGVVYDSTDLNIKFSSTESSFCQPRVWKVDEYDKSTGQRFINNNGVEGNPGIETLENWFKFEKIAFNVYKIVHCPSVCKSCVTLCSDVGIYSHGGVRRLALSHSALRIMFMERSIDGSKIR